MPYKQLTDKCEIEARLRRDTAIHIYEIGDLDPFFWPYTTWYCRSDDDDSDEIALVYRGSETPVLLAFGRGAESGLPELLRSIGPELPDSFHAHLSDGCVAALEDSFRFESFGLHRKMALGQPECLTTIDVSSVVPLRTKDLEEIEELYERAYPDGWFDPRMLETNMYFGVRRGSRLVSIAGIHVYSAGYGVAALGNITTDPTLRGSGLGSSVTARLCQELVQTCSHIGLNVKADNEPALACYAKLGFERVIDYHEGKLVRRK